MKLAAYAEKVREQERLYEAMMGTLGQYVDAQGSAAYALIRLLEVLIDTNDPEVRVSILEQELGIKLRD